MTAKNCFEALIMTATKNSEAVSAEPDGSEMTLDQYIEKLKSGLVPPRRAYGFNSLYDFQGKTNSQKGIIFVDTNLNFAGEIYDINSQVKRYLVEGKITIEENRMVMNFAKIPTSFMFNTIYYCLEKECAPEHFKIAGPTGNYHGLWSFNEKTLDVRKREEPGMGTALNIKDVEQSNKASLSLCEIRPDIYRGMPIETILRYI